MIAEDTLTLNSFDELEAMLADMAKPIEQPKIDQPTWQSVIEILQEMERGFFASSSGPDGEPWAQLSPATVKKKGHSIILRETYELMAGLTGHSGTSVRETTPTMLEFGTSRDWAWVHQAGSERVTASGRQWIPQRMMVGLTEESINDVLDVVADAAVMMMFQ